MLCLYICSFVSIENIAKKIIGMRWQKTLLLYYSALSILLLSCSPTEFTDLALNQNSRLLLGANEWTKNNVAIKIRLEKDLLPMFTDFDIQAQKIKKARELSDGRILLLSEGVLYLFDGHDEVNLLENELINDFELDSISQIIYVSTNQYIATLSKSEKGLYDVNIISLDSSIAQKFQRIEQTSRHIYFLNEKSILELNRSTKKAENFFLFPIGYSNIESFVLKDSLYVNIFPKGIFKFEGSKFPESYIEWGKYNKYEQKIIKNAYAYTGETEPQDLKYLGLFTPNLALFYSNKGFVVFDGHLFAIFDWSNEYDFKSLIPQNGISFNDSVFALATLNRGTMLMHKTKGKVYMSLQTEKEGLVSFSKVLTLDKNYGLWISQNNILQRWHFDLPLRLMHAEIKTGEIVSLFQDSNILYIGTNQGAYSLNLDTSNYLHYYDEIDFNVFQFIKYQNKILAAGNNAVYELSGKSAKPLLNLQVIRKLAVSEKLKSLFIATNQGLYYLNDSIKVPKKLGVNLQMDIFSMAVHHDSVLWLGLADKVLYSELPQNGVLERFYSIEMPLQLKSAVTIYSGADYFLLKHANVIYHLKNNDLLADSNSLASKNYRIYEGNDLLKVSEYQWTLKNYEFSQAEFLNQLNLISSLKYFWLSDNVLILAAQNKLYKANLIDSIQNNFSKVIVSKIENNDNMALNKINTSVKAYSEGIRLYLSHPFYFQESAAQYQYFIDGVSSHWSVWNRSAIVEIPFLPTGTFKIYFRAKDILGRKSVMFYHQINAYAPFYAQKWFFVIIFSVLASIVALLVYWIMRMRSEQIMEENRVLEKRIAERTFELRKKQDEITDSIRYASRIQKAVLPQLSAFTDFGIEYFIINKPKNVVSGDFYWIEARDSQLYFAVADSTGHGVPGAFMSILGISLLNHLRVIERQLPVNEVLNELRGELIAALNQIDQDYQVHDGIDMALICLDTSQRKLYFSGAYRPLYLLHESELIEIKAQRMPIGWYVKQKKFEMQEIDYKNGDIVYLFTDGFIDQTGMESEQKFSSGRFKDILIRIADKPLHIQKNILEEEFRNWKKKAVQVDDILLAALKL